MARRSRLFQPLKTIPKVDGPTANLIRISTEFKFNPCMDCRINTVLVLYNRVLLINLDRSQITFFPSCN